MTGNKKILKYRIEKLKVELYNEIKKNEYKNLCKGNVLEISKQIDELINIYLKLK